MPSPDALEGLGVRIGQIDIVVEDIFDPANPAEDAAPYRLANKLHINTREDAVCSQVLFAETEPFRNRKSRKRSDCCAGDVTCSTRTLPRVATLEDEQTVDLHIRVRESGA